MERWADTVLRVGYTWTGSSQDAQDVCQTVLLKLLTDPRRFPEERQEKAWVLRVTVNCCKDLKKSAWARRRVSLDALGAAVALSLLYGEGVPPLETALEGLSWFLSCGQPRREDLPEGGGPARFWFDFDAARIAASFRKSFGVDLLRARLHWFEFMALLDCLDEDSSLSNAIQLRGADTSQMKGRQRRAYERARRLLTPPPRYSDEEREAIEAFFQGG